MTSFLMDEKDIEVDEAQAGLDFVRQLPLQVIRDKSGAIVVAETSRQIGFAVHRIYFLTDLSHGSTRGGHAHKRLKQCFVCITGSVTLEIIKNGTCRSFRLDNSNSCIQVDEGCWRNVKEIAAGTNLLVLASDEYDEDDYIRDYDDFVQWEAKQSSRVAFTDLRRYKNGLSGKIDTAIHDVVASGYYIGGPEVGRFERAFADYCGVSHAVGVSNGLDALTLALRAHGVGSGDDVIVPAHTFIATILAVDAVGANPILVDVEEDTGLIDVTRVAKAVTNRLRAIIPVHLYGHPVDMDGLADALSGRSVLVLEDAAQAHGARYKGRPCGSLGHAAAFSFYPTKNLGALGDGGGLTTQDSRLADKVRKLGNYGSSIKYRHEIVGSNCRLDPLQAAILGVKLEKLDEWNARRREHAAHYLSSLAGIPGLLLPAVRPWAEPVWHVFPVRVPGQRDRLASFLEGRGIGTNIHYPISIHRQACYAGRWRGSFPVADQLADSLLSLPLDAMHTEAEITMVIEAVKEFFGAA